MEELIKIHKFLKYLKNEKNVNLPKFELYSDGSCGVSDFFMNTYIDARSLKGLIKKLENYQWDTNTNQNTNPAK